MAQKKNASRKGMSYMTREKKEQIVEEGGSEEYILKKSILDNKFYTKAIIKMLTEEVTCKNDLMDCMGERKFYGTSNIKGFYTILNELGWIEPPKDKPHQKPIRFVVLKEKIIEDIIQLLFYYPLKENSNLMRKFYENILHEKSIKQFLRNLNRLNPDLAELFTKDMKDLFRKQIIYKENMSYSKAKINKMRWDEFIDLIDISKTRQVIAKHIGSLIDNEKIKIHDKDKDFLKRKIVQSLKNIQKTSKFLYKTSQRQNAFMKQINLIKHFKALLINIKEKEMAFDREFKTVTILTGSIIASDQFLKAIKQFKPAGDIKYFVKKLRDNRKNNEKLLKMYNSSEGIFEYRRQFSTSS
ncbi:hypothetical protein K9M74_00490 [Candidatus Woesearchaeota archaeon]|nr:hypothetical protein [Candidatus Woesearchaeota archaeon]